MTESEIFENLCSYDPRTPDFDPEVALGRKPRDGECCCDNCFYGRDKMATALLSCNDRLKQLQQDINDMYNSRQTQFARCECGHLHDDNWVCDHCKSGG